MNGSQMAQFLQLCGANDAKILSEPETAKFSDLIRLMYIARELELGDVEVTLFNALCAYHRPRLDQYLTADEGNEYECEGIMDESEQVEKWLTEFNEQIPGKKESR